MRFTRHRGGRVRAEVDEVEGAVLRQLAGELLVLVEEPRTGDDPLAALVGLPESEVHPPDDPVLARLLPPAYRDDDGAAAEFRRYTDADLRTRKRQDATALLASLPDGAGRVELDRDACDRWLGALNDMRLALGTALGVTEDDEEPPEDDPRWQPLQVYGWLGWLQESLLSCVDPRHSA
jgi:hypothetical protein